MDTEQYHKYLQSAEWKRKAYKRMKIDNFRCVMCGCSGRIGNELQCHHVSYRNIGNEDVYRDLMTLCKADHKAIHRAMQRVTDARGHRGWRDCSAIPTVNVLTLSGADLLVLTGEDNS